MRSNVLWILIACAFTRMAVAETPRNLIITYRCDPANRPAFRTYLLGEQRTALDKLKEQGAIERYQILAPRARTPSPSR